MTYVRPGMRRAFGAVSAMIVPPMQVVVTGAPDTKIEGLSSEPWIDTANNNAPITKVFFTDDDGNVTFKFIDQGGTEVTQSPSFQPAAIDRDVEQTLVYATNTDSASAEYGRVVAVERHDVFKDGALDPALTKFFDMNQTPPVDVTAVVTAVPYELNPAPVRVELTGEPLAVTGAVSVGFAAIAASATYAEVYVEDSNIRWTKDGSDPADNNGEQENMGATIRLLDRDEIEGFRALPIDMAGVLDGSLTANLTVNYWNIAPDED